MMRVAIVGAGTVGTRLALRCAAHGCAVTLIGRERARAAAALEEAARETAIEAHAIRVVDRLDAVAEAELVAELVPEHLDVKRRLYAELEPLLPPHVPIASGTSSFVPDALGERLAAPGRLIVAHMVHPVTVVPIVELVAPREPDPAALATVERWIATLGMRAIRLRAAVNGFIVNRLQFALLREAASLVERGVVDAGELDTVVELALGPRWSATGPLASALLGGQRTFATIAREVLPALDRRDTIPLLEREAPVRSWTAGECDDARALRRAVYEAVDRARRPT